MVDELYPQNQIIENKMSEEETPEKRNTERTLKIFSVVIGIFALFALVYIKLKNKDFPLFWTIFIGVTIVVVSLLLWFSFSIFRYAFKDKEEEERYRGKLPKPISLAELRKIADEALTNPYYCNHAKKCLSERYVHVGKNNSRIYIYKTEALYKDENMAKGIVYIIINAHYPDELKTILIDPGVSELTRAIIHMGTEQEPEPNIEESFVYNPMLGVYETKKKVTKPEERKREDKQEGDLK